MGSRVPIPGCLTFFTAVWRVFHTTFESEEGSILDSPVRCRRALTCLVDLLRGLIFRLALTLRSFAHGIVCLQTLTALASSVQPNIIALRFNDDALSTIPPVVVWTLARLHCDHLDPLHSSASSLVLLRSSTGTPWKSSIQLIFMLMSGITALSGFIPCADFGMMHAFPRIFPMLS